MRILLINICLRPESKLKLVPIGLAYIATAMKKAGFDFDILDIDVDRLSDQQIDQELEKDVYDVVCMGCIVTGYKMVKQLAAMVRAKSPNATIIVGNSVATSIPEILLKNTEADITVMGEGDLTIIEILESISHGKSWEYVEGICFKKNNAITATNKRELIKDISTLPVVDFSIFDIEKYISTSEFAVSDPLPFKRSSTRALPVNTARGCIANCSFCYHVFKYHRYRYRTPSSICEEISQMILNYNLNYILLWDELTFFSKKQVKEFCREILDRKLCFAWGGSCRGNLFQEDKDLETIEMMKQAGCVRMGYSLESSDETILRFMNKRISVDQFSRQTKLFKKAGIPVVTSLVLGFPQETPATIEKTFDCCISNEIYPSAGYLLPQPGSAMYLYAIEHGYITDEEDYLMSMGDRQDLRLNMTSMSDEQFEHHVMKGLRRCNQMLGVGLDDSGLIKTQYYRSTKTARVETS